MMGHSIEPWSNSIAHTTDTGMGRSGEIDYWRSQYAKEKEIFAVHLFFYRVQRKIPKRKYLSWYVTISIHAISSSILVKSEIALTFVQ